MAFPFWLTLGVITTFAQGGILELNPGAQEREGVKLSSLAKAVLPSGTAPLTSVGSGLRYKKVLFVKAKVYVAELFVSQPEKFVRTEAGALASLADSKVVAMHLTFLRDVDADTLANAFREAFRENKVDFGKDPIARLLKAVEKMGGPKEKQTVVMVGEKKAGDVIHYQGPDGSSATVQGGTGLIAQVFSLWLGTPVDSGVESLKKEIIQ